MNLLWMLFPCLIAFFSAPLCIYFCEKRTKAKREAKLKELKLAPFPFKVDRDNDIIFDLGEADLHCGYSFGIRKDGVYGISDLTLLGVNTSCGRIELKMGQSILPILSKVEQLAAWADSRPFKTRWTEFFLDNWKAMKESLDNFAVVTYEQEQREVK